MISRLHTTHHARLVLAVFALLLVAFLAAAGHVVLADVGHDTSHCLICTWFHFQGWIAAAVQLVVFLTEQGRCACLHTRPTVIFFFQPSGRSPPHCCSCQA